jgi:hypothetical protein
VHSQENALSELSCSRTCVQVSADSCRFLQLSMGALALNWGADITAALVITCTDQPEILKQRHQIQAELALLIRNVANAFTRCVWGPCSR